MAPSIPCFPVCGAAKSYGIKLLSGDMARIRDIAPAICRGFVIFEVRRRSLRSNLRVKGTRMVYDLSSFTESGSGKRIAVNPLLVRFVIEIDDKTVAVVFDKVHQIIVDGTVAGVSEHLRKAVR